jgi:hypothetical protein
MPEEKLVSEDRLLGVLKEWNSRPNNPPSLLELIKVAFPEKPELDGRSKEAREIKEFLATHSIKPKGAHIYTPKDGVELTDEQKEFIVNNIATMGPVEIGRILFKNGSLTNLNLEVRAISEYVKTLDRKVIYQQEDEEVPSGEYKPPRTFERAIQRANKYLHEGIDKDKVTPRQKKEVNSLIGYMNTYRFTHQIAMYQTQTDRDLYESSFIRYTYDKADLTQEEVDQYIVLSNEVVISSNIQRRVEKLQRLLDETADSADGTENVRISMSLVEAINTAQNEYNQCVNRQQKLLNDLKEKRSDRLKNQIKENASIINLVQMWKEEESRLKLLKLAELRKQSVSQEIERLSTMDEVKARILGLSEDEALNG